MLGYVRRLATTGFAYTAASLLSKIVAVGLLPIYTRYLAPADYGSAEIMFTFVVAASIVIRFGVIESLLRFYYQEDEVPREVIATGFASLLITASLFSAIALIFAAPLSEAMLGTQEAGLARIAIGGLWVFTLYEYLVTIFRLDERAREYFFFTLGNVVATIPTTVILIVVLDLGAEGLLTGTYAAALPFLVYLIVSERRRLALIPDRELLRRMLRFGMPTMPAELSLYALQFIDRIIIARLVGLAEAGLYALAFKFSQAIQVMVRGFQLAWPPLAYSIRDDDEARGAYSLIVTWFTALCLWGVVGLWLESRWIVRLLAAPEFYEAHEAIGLLSLGATLYAVYLVLLVVLGRTGRTEYNFPATAAGLITNIALNLILVPPYGIVGAGVALVISYLIVLALMFFFTQRLFPVPYEWGRMGVLLALTAIAIGGGELLLPSEGAVGFITRAGVWAAFPALLVATPFMAADERNAIRRFARNPRFSGA